MILPRILIVTVGVGIISPIMKQSKNAKRIILQIVPVIIIAIIYTSLSTCIISYNAPFVNSIFKFNKKIRAVLQHCSTPNFFTSTSISKRALDNSQDYRIRTCDKLRPAVLDSFTKP